MGVSAANGKKAHTCFWGGTGGLASVQAGNKSALVINTHTAS